MFSLRKFDFLVICWDSIWNLSIISFKGPSKYKFTNVRVPPKFFTQKVCRELKKVEKHCSRSIIFLALMSLKEEFPIHFFNMLHSGYLYLHCRSFLFFSMLLSLGLGSQIGILEGMIGPLFDIPSLKNVKKPVITGMQILVSLKTESTVRNNGFCENSTWSLLKVCH